MPTAKKFFQTLKDRIAERFLNKQKAEAKQVISLSDVDELISAMGTVADFEAIEQAEDIFADPLQSAAPRNFNTKRRNLFFCIHLQLLQKQRRRHPAAPEKTYTEIFAENFLVALQLVWRHYFTIDPLWVRLAFLFAVIGLPAGSGMLDLNMEDEFGPLSGMVVLVYIAMWIAFPGSTTLEEDTKIKKFYRNPDRKVVGGVASGVASYFGVDLGVVRFLMGAFDFCIWYRSFDLHRFVDYCACGQYFDRKNGNAGRAYYAFQH